MDEDRASTVRGWRSRSVEGYAGLHRLASEEFSGVIETDGGAIRAFMTNGKVVGVAGGDVDDLDGAAMTAYAAPGDAIPLLFAMREGSGDPRAQYYTEETPLSEVNSTLEQGGFTGYVELSENVLSGDYYVVYHGGRSSSVAFVGTTPRLLTDGEAFERAAAEVGIYTVHDADVSVIDLPGGEAVEHATDAGGVVGGGEEGDAADPADAGADSAAGSTDDRGDTAPDGSAGTAGASDDAGPSTDEASEVGEASDADAALDTGTAADPGSTTTAPSVTTSDSDGEERDPDDRSIRGVGGGSANSGSSSSGTGPYSGGEEIRVGAGLGLDEDRDEDHVDAGGPADQDPDERDVDADGPADGDASEPADVADTGGLDVADAGGQAEGDEAGEPTEDDAGGVAPAGGESVDASTDPPTDGGDPPETAETAVDHPADESVEGDASDPTTDEVGEAPVERGEETSTGHRVSGTSVDRGDELADPAGEETADVSIGSADGVATDRTDSAAARTTDAPAAADPASSTGVTPDPELADDADPTATPDRDRLESELDEVREERDRLESELREARDELDRVRAERDDYRAEVERLQERIETLEGRIETLEAGGAGATGRSLAPAEALADTNLFVRYGSKAEPTLETAHEGNADPEDVNRNLRIEHHTRFEADDVVVDGEPFESFLTSTFEYRFVEWVIRDLLYELRSTGKEARMEGLYDAIPAIDRVQFGGAIEVGDGSGGAGEEGADRREFDVILRDGMGGPLLVANLHESRDPTEGTAITTLIEDARTVAVTADTIGSAFVVTRSYYEPPALDAASDATGGGFLGRSRHESYVKMDRKRGFHLCLAEARDEEFNLRIPEL